MIIIFIAIMIVDLLESKLQIEGPLALNPLTVVFLLYNHNTIIKFRISPSVQRCYLIYNPCVNFTNCSNTVF